MRNMSVGYDNETFTTINIPVVVSILWSILPIVLNVVFNNVIIIEVKI